MIRIDEIYNNTIFPWLEKNRPGFRLFLCEPFGRSDPDSVINYGSDVIHEHNYIFMFDQEPINLNNLFTTFYQVYSSCFDITHPGKDREIYDLHTMPPIVSAGYICTSEKNSEEVAILCKRFKWKPLYYFFHGWAALDWYRGYDRTFLIKPIAERLPTKTFIAPNRIIAGERKHRLEILYHIFKQGMTDNHISCPAVCPVEQISIVDAAEPLLHVYPDIQDIFRSQQLPIMFEGETDHPMHSCWLSLFDQAADSLLYLVTETVATGKRLHLTEKTFKPIALGMPFVLVATAGSLEYLRSYGFKTFGHIWDESYDTIADPHQRIAAVAGLLRSLCDLSVEERIALFHDAIPTIEHNWNHFYGGGFEAVLWDELQAMLNGIESSS